MATGIVSFGLARDGRDGLSLVLLWAALGLWLSLGVVAAARLVVDRDRLCEELADPSCLAGVAATCVLATDLASRGDHAAAAPLLAGGALLLVLLAPRPLTAAGLQPGSAFLLAVAPCSASVAAATLAPWAGSWLLALGAGLAALGIAGYALALSRFDLRQLLAGAGDQWIAGGGAAIAALACSKLALTSARMETLKPLREMLHWLAAILAGIAALWLIALAAAEVARRRTTFDRRRWGTAFPIAMFAAMSFSIAQLQGSEAIRDLARVWVWVGVAVWALCALAVLSRAAGRGGTPASPLAVAALESGEEAARRSLEPRR